MIAKTSRSAPDAKPLTPTEPALVVPWSVRLHDNAPLTDRSRLVTMTTAAGERATKDRNADRATAP